MDLSVRVPLEQVVATTALRLCAEGRHGGFTLLPAHVDCVAELVPCILSYEVRPGQERYVAVDEGLLVKCGRRVRVAVNRAVAGDDLARLEAAVQGRFLRLDARERQSRRVLARLEASLLLGMGDLLGRP
jgi:F-type H+-transporting ATPase subunit epsilon